MCSVINPAAFCFALFSAAPYWISGPPKNLVLAPGENGALTCRASGTPKPTVTWAMNGIPIESEYNEKTHHHCYYSMFGLDKRFFKNCINFHEINSSISFTDSPKDFSRKVEDDTIIFTDAQIGSSAVYQCNVSNEYGYLLSNAFVNVLCKLFLGQHVLKHCFHFY